MSSAIESLVNWIASTSLSSFVTQYTWVWATCETIHFLGLTLLIGTVGAFDLRLLGVAKHLPISAMHRLIPWGIFGFAINATTGLLFIFGAPDQYIYNPAFHLKALFIVLAGINVLVFYSSVFQQVEKVGPGEDAPVAARIIGGFSLFLWIGVMCFGRMLTFFRPIPGLPN